MSSPRQGPVDPRLLRLARPALPGVAAQVVLGGLGRWRTRRRWWPRACSSQASSAARRRAAGDDGRGHDADAARGRSRRRSSCGPLVATVEPAVAARHRGPRRRTAARAPPRRRGTPTPSGATRAGGCGASWPRAASTTCGRGSPATCPRSSSRWCCRRWSLVGLLVVDPAVGAGRGADPAAAAGVRGAGRLGDPGPRGPAVGGGRAAGRALPRRRHRARDAAAVRPRPPAGRRGGRATGRRTAARPGRCCGWRSCPRPRWTWSATLSVGLVAVEAGLRVVDGPLGLGPALVAILLAPEAYRPMREVGARFHDTAPGRRPSWTPST